MTAVPLYGGPLKRDLIQMAYEECGQAGYEFDISAEEYAYALRRLDALMAQWQARGIDLGYAFPETGPASAQEESGIPYSAQDTVAVALAMSLAPGIGKTLSGEVRARLAQGMALLPRQAPQPMQLGRQTIRGAGNRGGLGWRDPFFRVPVTPAADVVPALPEFVPDTPASGSPDITNTPSSSTLPASTVDGFVGMAHLIATLTGGTYTVDETAPCATVSTVLAALVGAVTGIPFVIVGSDTQDVTFERMIAAVNAAPLLTIDNTPSNSSHPGSQVQGFILAMNGLVATINGAFG